MRQILFVGTICAAMFTNQVGLGNSLATVGVIGKSFGITEQGELSWLIAGYSLTIGTFILIGGRFGDEFGHKRMFIIGMSWCSFWSLVAGLAVYSSYILFIFARVFQGMGPALTMPNSLAILGQAYPTRVAQEHGFCLVRGIRPFGAIAGFLFGGIFALIWWPWIYWSEAMALAVVAVLGTWSIPPLPVRKQRRTLQEILMALEPSCWAHRRRSF